MVEHHSDEYDSPTEDNSDATAGRRQFLQLTGTAAASLGALATQAGNARASCFGSNDSGYGSGGYGEGTYGGI